MPHLLARLRGRRHRLGLVAVAAAALLAVPAIVLAAASPPTGDTSPPDTTLVTDTYALLGGLVQPNGTPTSYQFEWGTTTAYGQTTPLTPAGNGTADVPVDVSLDDLTPATTYHYRIVITSTDPAHPATVQGSDQSFTTAPALALTIYGGRKRIKNSHLTLNLACTGPTDEDCAGRLYLKARVKGHLVGAGSVHYRVATRTAKLVSVFVPYSVRKTLKTAKKHQIKGLAQTKVETTKTPTTANLTLVG